MSFWILGRERTLYDLFLPDRFWLLDILLGIVAGFAFIGLLGLVPAITIGIPSFFSTIGERIWLTTVVAPIIEEGALRLAALWALLTLGGIITAILAGGAFQLNDIYETEYNWLGIVLSILIIPIFFALFHAVTYAGVFDIASIKATLGLFIGAWLFGLATVGLTFGTKNILSAIVMHMSVNLYLVFDQMSLVVIA